MRSDAPARRRAATGLERPGRSRIATCTGPAVVSAGPTACGLPWAGDQRPWGQGPDGARGRLYTVCFTEVTGRSRDSLKRRSLRHRTPAWLRLGPACRSPCDESPVDIRVARARTRNASAAAPGGGSWERDRGNGRRRRLGGSGSNLPRLRPDSEARREDPEPEKRGLGGQPVTPGTRRAGGRATRPCRLKLQARLPGPGRPAIERRPLGPGAVSTARPRSG